MNESKLMKVVGTVIGVVIACAVLAFVLVLLYKALEWAVQL